MIINAVSVCIDYSDYFKYCIEANKKHFDRWVVVTVENDIRTIELCKEHGVEYVFANERRLYLYRSALRKGTAINKGLDHLYVPGCNEWFIHIDSDIVLPNNFREFIDGNFKLNDDYNYYKLDTLVRRNLYCMNRFDVTLPRDGGNVETSRQRIKEAFYNMNLHGYSGKQGNLGWGYFQMFHMTALRQTYQSLRPYVYPEMSCNAGFDDLLFTKLFNSVKCFDNINCVHLSPQAHNWEGNKTKMLLEK
jgi:hypothetical protein|tara:strand:- start:1047 stop:1790 length:744 start_codon:yes stop_codon:yes gene_type:complete